MSLGLPLLGKHIVLIFTWITHHPVIPTSILGNVCWQSTLHPLLTASDMITSRSGQPGATRAYLVWGLRLTVCPPSADLAQALDSRWVKIRRQGA